jgi:hypothetical protein
VGFAAVFGKNWFAEKWQTKMAQLHINILELFPIVLAIEIWGHKIANHKIILHSDNKATVHVINNMTSKDRTMMKLVRKLVLNSLRHNILFRARHIAGKSNFVADHLSRFRFQEAFLSLPSLNPQPTYIQKNQLQI